MTTDRDRETPPDPLPRARQRSRPEVDPATLQDAERQKREALAALRKVGTQRGAQTPYRPPPDRSSTPESGGVPRQGGGYIPDVVLRSVPPPSKGPTRADWAKLAYKLVAAVVGALVLVIGAAGVMWVARINAKAEEAKAQQTDQAKAVDARELEWQTWARAVRAVSDCRERRNVERWQQVLPAKDKMGSALKPTPFEQECPAELPKPP